MHRLFNCITYINELQIIPLCISSRSGFFLFWHWKMFTVCICDTVNCLFVDHSVLLWHNDKLWLIHVHYITGSFSGAFLLYKKLKTIEMRICAIGLAHHSRLETLPLNQRLTSIEDSSLDLFYYISKPVASSGFHGLIYGWTSAFNQISSQWSRRVISLQFTTKDSLCKAFKTQVLFLSSVTHSYLLKVSNQ